MKLPKHLEEQAQDLAAGFEAGFFARDEKLKALVDKQAKDEGLWFNAKYVTEAYLQNALRELHAAIEGIKK